MDGRALRRPLLAAIALLAALGFAAVGPASASGGTSVPRQADADVYIDVIVDGPPSVRASLEIVLTRGADDVTSSCSPFATPGDPRPMLRCADLPDGTYTVDVVGVPSGFITEWDCSDIVAATAPRDAIPIDRERAFTQWQCGVTVFEPGVLLVWDTRDDRSLDVSAPDGSTVDACEADPTEGVETRWCSAGAGAYTVEIVGAVGDESSELSCGPGSVTSTTPNTQTLTVPAGGPLGTCTLNYTPQIAVLINWVAVAGDTAEWLTIDAIDVSGGPTDGSVGMCTLTGTAMVETESDFGLTCDGLSDGIYSISLVGVPPGHRIDNGCEFVEVVDGVTFNCQIDVFTPAWIAGDAGLPPPGDSGGDDDLPVAGGTVHLLFLVGALVTGVGLLVLSAPRLIPVRVDRRGRRAAPVHSGHDRNAVHHR